MLVLILFCLAMAVVPAYVFARNLRALVSPPRPDEAASRPAVSVLIPARNEQDTIGPAVSSALLSRDVVCEVLVLDDRSTDETVAIVDAMTRRDDRVRLIRGPELPSGWCGKPHACWVLAQTARYPLLVFLDADVRLASDALARMAAFLDRCGADLASGVPRQETIGLLEKLVIPLIHFILLGFLPTHRMRRSNDPRFAAGCGQLFIARRDAYRRAAGHSAIRNTLHDGLMLPRAFRSAGLRTDLFDASDLAVCRMYRTAGALWNGLAKNAGEALASPRLTVPSTLILLAGQVLPAILLILGLAAIPHAWPWRHLAITAVAVVGSYYPRLAAIGRFRQSVLGAILHPVGILVLLAIQWYALVKNLSGRPVTWKGRPYVAGQVIDSPAWEHPVR